jgi:phage baseplate assembly protein W
MQLAIKVPFQVGETGSIATITDPTVLAAQEIKTVLLTSLGERLMRPTVGSGFNARLFAPLENADFYTAMVMDALNKQCILSTIQQALVSVNGNDGTLSLSVQYTPITGSLSQSLVVTI